MVVEEETLSEKAGFGKPEYRSTRLTAPTKKAWVKNGQVFGTGPGHVTFCAGIM